MSSAGCLHVRRVGSWISESQNRPHLIFLPCGAMAIWTLLNVVRLAGNRYAALVNKTVSMAYYKLYDPAAGKSKGEPEHLIKLSHHVENLFEAPPLFYAVCAALFSVKGGVTPTTTSLAWLYVVLRMIHSVVHTGSNNVSHRFYSYGSSTVVLMTLWGITVKKCIEL